MVTRIMTIGPRLVKGMAALAVNGQSFLDFLEEEISASGDPSRQALLRDHRDRGDRQPATVPEAPAAPLGPRYPLRIGRLRHRHGLLQRPEEIERLTP